MLQRSFMSVSALLISANMSMAEPPDLNSEFGRSILPNPSNCDHSIETPSYIPSGWHQTLYHRITTIGCELQNQDRGQPDFLKQQVSMLQEEMRTLLEQQGIEADLAVDGILGPQTAGAFVDYVISLNAAYVFLPELTTEFDPNVIYIERFIDELKGHSPHDIEVGHAWAENEYNELIDNLRNMFESPLFTPETFVPACEVAKINIYFDDACYWEATVQEQLNVPAPQTATYSSFDI